MSRKIDNFKFVLLVRRRCRRRRRDSTTEKSIAESEMMMMMMSVRGCTRERDGGGLRMKIMSRKRFVVNFNMAMAGMLLRGG